MSILSDTTGFPMTPPPLPPPPPERPTEAGVVSTGWLAAQSQKKAPGKALPKGLGKSSPAPVAAKKPVSASTSSAAAKPKPKPAPAKKIDLKPKDTAEDDGWGDGW